MYSGIRLTPEEIAQSAVEEDADLIGASILSGSHVELTRQLVGALAAAGGADIPLVIGGIIPRHDIATLEGLGVRKVFTPSDYELGEVMERLMDVIEARAA